jgi:UDP-N-acetylglucosamine--N-acetylmuramyl-(pentapeptide) pyrophosphoryl-undecaprenol N-acetylglucosamine transferase
VIHFTGKDDPQITYAVPNVVKAFEDDMAAAYAVADLVVCRCGAGTCAELIRYQLPSIVIPYPYAHDHQRKNGEYLKNGTRMILQKETTPETLRDEIEKLKTNIQLHKKALSQFAWPKTTDFGQLVRSVGGKS